MKIQYLTDTLQAQSSHLQWFVVKLKFLTSPTGERGNGIIQNAKENNMKWNDCTLTSLIKWNSKEGKKRNKVYPI